MNVFVFDIETIPDIDGCRRLYDLHGLSDDDVAKAVFHKRRQQANTEFLRHHLHRVVAISAVLRTRDQFKVWSLGDLESSEQDLLERFYSGIERYTPRLVSWNGGGFDLPVIHYRSLLYPLNAGHYWENGQNDTSFRYNNYLSRFHDRHTDLMDVLAAYQPRASAPLDEIASLCGFPGKMGMDGSKVWDSYARGDVKSIRDYCETDVLNTYLVYLNYQRNRGQLDQQQYLGE
ncbi:MAG: 3'-5' exonuclease, partial [Gammaproteobacteria bacterium]|nr:3'-5' exonuclease [Gammaproteobacteria bacterium]